MPTIYERERYIPPPGYTPPYDVPPIEEPFLPEFKELPRRKKVKKAKKGYKEEFHLIGDPLTALASGVKGFEEFSGMLKKPKKNGIHSGFITDKIHDELFGGIALPKSKRRGKSGAYGQGLNLANCCNVVVSVCPLRGFKW